MSRGKPVAKARPKQASAPSSSSFSTGIPSHSRKWIDVESGEQHARSYPIVKRMNTLLRPEPLLRDEDGAIDIGRLKMQFESGFPNSVHWSVRSRINHSQRGGGERTFFSILLILLAKKFFTFELSFRKNPVDPFLQDNVLIPNDLFKYINHVGCYINLHSIIDSGTIAGGRNSSREGETVFFTAVDPMAMRHHEQKEFDLTKPRPALYKQKWKVHQDAVYWIDIRVTH